VLPLLKQHCVKCHGPTKQEGALALHALQSDLLKGKDIEKWQAIGERLALNEMPPESEPRPDALAAALLEAWPAITGVRVEVVQPRVDPTTGISIGYCTNGFDRHAIRQARRGVGLSSRAAACAIG
jgi:hypothetical protein